MGPIETAGAVQAAADLSPVALFVHADIVVKVVMILLIFASVWCWAIIADKTIRLRRLDGGAEAHLGDFKRGTAIATLAGRFKGAVDDPFARLFAAVAGEIDETSRAGLDRSTEQKDGLQDRVHRVGVMAIQVEMERLQRGLSGLATIGSVAPFVGLFGTVWGIMNSFAGIAASNNTSLAVVAPGIAEALFATATGLVAAIPATMAYNRLSGDIARYAKRLNAFLGALEVELSRSLAGRS